MALDFGDAGLFDPIPPANNKHKNKEDDENENVQAATNGGWKEDEDKEIPEDDVDDEFEDWPTAPPLDILDCIKGYEMVSFDAVPVPPPPFEEVVEVATTEEKTGQDNGEANEDGEEIKSKVSLSVCCASH